MDGAVRALSRSQSSSDIRAAAEEAFVEAATSLRHNEKQAKLGKGSRHYKTSSRHKRSSQRHYHTIQNHYLIDEPSGLLPVDVDPPFYADLETDGHLPSNPTEEIKDVDNPDQSIGSFEAPLESSVRRKSSRRTNTTDSESKNDRNNYSKQPSYVKAVSLPPEDQLSVTGEFHPLTYSASPSSPSSKRQSNESSPLSSAAASPDIKKTASKSFFAPNHRSKSNEASLKSLPSVRSKSEESKTGRNKNRSRLSEHGNSMLSSSPKTITSLNVVSNFKGLTIQEQQNLDWQVTKPKLTDRSSHLLETGLWADCQFHVGLPPNIKVISMLT